MAFTGNVYPDAIVLDLAVLAAGLTPWPLDQVGDVPGGPATADAARQEPSVRRDAAVGAGCAAWLQAVGEQARVTLLDAPPPPADPGVMLEGVQGEAGSWRRLDPAGLLAAAALVEDALASLPGRVEVSRERQILVAGRPLREWAGRLLSAWAITAGAALVLEADPVRRLGAALWARPTVFHGSAAEIAALRRQVDAAPRPGRWRLARRRPGPPLGRLRTLFQDEAPAPEAVAYWSQRGARLLHLPVYEEPGGGAGMSVV